MTNFLPKFGTKIDKICPENPGYAPDELCVTPGPGCPFIRESPKMTPFSYKRTKSCPFIRSEKTPK